MPRNKQEVSENWEEDTNNYCTLALNFHEQDLKATAKLGAEKTRYLYTLATNAVRELEVDDVTNNYDYCYDI